MEDAVLYAETTLDFCAVALIVYDAYLLDMLIRSLPEEKQAPKKR